MQTLFVLRFLDVSTMFPLHSLLFFDARIRLLAPLKFVSGTLVTLLAHLARFVVCFRHCISDTWSLVLRWFNSTYNTRFRLLAPLKFYHPHPRVRFPSISVKA